MDRTVTTEVSLGDRRKTVHIRPDTSDMAALSEVFGAKPFDLRRFKRGRELFGFAAEQAGSGKRALVVDAGANIGASSIFFSFLLPGSLVVAIEPVAANFALLERNTVDLGVRCIRAALAASKGLDEVVAPRDPGAYWAYQTAALGSAPSHADGPPEIVQRVTMNDIYAEEAGRAFPFVAKIDIEGGEDTLFSANTEWVERTPVLFIELHDRLMPKQRRAASFLRCIATLDRDFITADEHVISIANRLG